MRHWIGRKLTGCGVSLTQFGLNVRGIKPSEARVEPAPAVTPGTIVPRELGPLGQATSDSGVLVLEAIAVVQGEHIAADAATGYADAFARFAVRHPQAFE